MTVFYGAVLITLLIYWQIPFFFQQEIQVIVTGSTRDAKIDPCWRGGNLDSMLEGDTKLRLK